MLLPLTLSLHSLAALSSSPTQRAAEENRTVAWYGRDLLHSLICKPCIVYLPLPLFPSSLPLPPPSLFSYPLLRPLTSSLPLSLFHPSSPYFLYPLFSPLTSSFPLSLSPPSSSYLLLPPLPIPSYLLLPPLLIPSLLLLPPPSPSPNPLLPPLTFSLLSLPNPPKPLRSSGPHCGGNSHSRSEDKQRCSRGVVPIHQSCLHHTHMCTCSVILTRYNAAPALSHLYHLFSTCIYLCTQTLHTHTLYCYAVL